MMRLLTTCLALATALTAGAQRTVVADADTRQPIAHASLYTKEQGRFRSAVTDVYGRATVAFAFQRLTVSHLNYETATLRHLPDTILLKPRFRQTAEVVVTNKEPEWIRRKLRRVAKTKAQRYFTRPDTLRFSYLTQSIGTGGLYRLHIAGDMGMRSTAQKHYCMRPDTCHITAADTTRLTDVANLRRMLYEDFVEELDADFISSHKWGENPDYHGRSADEVELLFRSKHRTDDRGRIVVDTARCIILEAVRSTGTKTNKHERLSPMLYAMARAISGYRIDTWMRDYRVVYALRPDGTLYPAQVRYKLYYYGQDGTQDKDQQEFAEQTGGGFPNMESVLTLTPGLSPLTPHPSPLHWEELHPSWYLRLSSDEARQRDIRQANLPATFTIYNGEAE